MASTAPQQHHTPTSSTFGWGNSSLSRTLNRRSPFGSSRVVVAPSSSATAPGQQPAQDASVSADGKRQTLFGPHIGGDDEDDDDAAFATTPAGAGQGPAAKETVSVDTVKAWIEKAKATDAPHPTTTLQSLVNLKRPSLSFTPLATSPKLHTLKFTFDAASPTALVTVRLFLPSPTVADPHLHVSEVIWSDTVPGGFGQVFVLPDQGAIDLSHATGLFERLAKDRESSFLKRKDSSFSASGDENGTGAEPLDSQQAAAAANGGRRRGGGLFGFGRSSRQQPSDIENQTQAVQMTAVGGAAASTAQDDKKDVKLAARIVVRLEARGEKGEALASLNAQHTHIEIAPVAPASSTSVLAPLSEESELPTPSPAAEAAPVVAEGTIEVAGGKATSWTAKVVRREALIGSHTFHLREIFGLTSSSTGTTASPSASTSYPPTSDAADDPYASTPNECIVCLVSPRDVVLLPCRHLVVCKDCAIGMVEFGAGGKVLRRDGDGEVGGSGGGGTDAAGAEVGGAAGDATATPTTTQAPAPTRRKKKAKGWACPICRQAYTSMLRIALPSTKAGLQTTLELEESQHEHEHEHEHEREQDIASAHPQSDAISVRSRRTVPGPRAPSPVPTLPGRAPSVLYPDGVPSDEDEDEDEQPRQAAPQFVLGPEETDEDKRRRIEKTV